MWERGRYRELACLTVKICMVNKPKIYIFTPISYEDDSDVAFKPPKEYTRWSRVYRYKQISQRCCMVTVAKRIQRPWNVNISIEPLSYLWTRGTSLPQSLLNTSCLTTIRKPRQDRKLEIISRLKTLYWRSLSRPPRSELFFALTGCRALPLHSYPGCKIKCSPYVVSVTNLLFLPSMDFENLRNCTSKSSPQD